VGCTPRTLLISPFFDAAVPSGGVLYSVDTARGWLRRGRRVAVLCAARPRSLADLQADVDEGRLTLHPFGSPDQIRFTHHPDDGLRRMAAGLIADFKPDVIHGHNTHGFVSALHAAIESPVPVVLTALDFGLLCFNFYLYRGAPTPCPGPVSSRACAECVLRTIHGPARWLGLTLPKRITRKLWPRWVRLDEAKSAAELHVSMRHILRHADAIIAPSPIMADKLREFGVPASRLVPILYGLTPEKIMRPEKTPSESLRLAFLGSAEPVKGLRVLMRAADRLPDGLPLEIRAIGGDPVRELVERCPARAKRYVSYRPALFGRDLALEHARIDAALVPSLWPENSPFVVLESLANGTPVIASDQPGIRHLVIPEHTGWLIEPGRSGAWTRALVEALQRPARIRRMQANARFTRTTADFLNDLEELESALIPGRAHDRPARRTPVPVPR